ncbi:MAG: GNAT family N-acetyltransferase [Phycisphaerae bacterium]
MKSKQPSHLTWRKGRYLATTDPKAIDADAALRMLHTTYWASHRSMECFLASLKHSKCISLLDGKRQIGFARWISDWAVFAWLTDVVIDKEYRGKGLGKFLIRCALEMPEVKGLRIWLSTMDAKGLYEKFGFESIEAMRLISKDDTPDASWGKPANVASKAARKRRLTS